MNTPPRRAGAPHPVLWVVGVLALALLACGGYWVFAPDATAFAGGQRVALAEYHDKDPTGVPEELQSASLVERGLYLTRAADCAACHSAKGGIPFAGGRARHQGVFVHLEAGACGGAVQHLVVSLQSTCPHGHLVGAVQSG